MSSPVLKMVYNNNDRLIMKIFGGIHDIKGNSKPYFTITGEMKDCCGCIHDEIMKYHPEFKDLIDMHLSDIDGIPMHCVENGWYWMGKTKWEPANVKNIARHFRIDEKTAEELIEMETKEELIAWVETMKPVWKKEAEAVIKKHDLKIF